MTDMTTAPPIPLPRRYRLPSTLAAVPGDIVADVMRRLVWNRPSIPDADILRACRARVALGHLQRCDAEITQNIQRGAAPAPSLAEHDRRTREWESLVSWSHQLFDVCLHESDLHTRDLLDEYLQERN
jgi:hypothetical protein